MSECSLNLAHQHVVSSLRSYFGGELRTEQFCWWHHHSVSVNAMTSGLMSWRHGDLRFWYHHQRRQEVSLNSECGDVIGEVIRRRCGRTAASQSACCWASAGRAASAAVWWSAASRRSRDGCWPASAELWSGSPAAAPPTPRSRYRSGLRRSRTGGVELNGARETGIGLTEGNRFNTFDLTEAEQISPRIPKSL